LDTGQSRSPAKREVTMTEALFVLATIALIGSIINVAREE